jgi:Laminin G domain
MKKTTLMISLAITIAIASFAAEKPVRVDLSRERAGSEPARFLAVVGDWTVATDAGRKVLQVDGRQWIKGQPSAGLAAKARTIYGAKHEDFIDSVKAYAYFPYAVARDIPDFHDGEISMRFRLLGGQLDQCAGILFNLKPNGDYLTVRFNGKEDNVVLWTFKSGKRSFVKKGAHDVHLRFGEWHRLKVRVEGTKVTASLDDEALLEYTLEAPVSGKVGVWSKTDSVSQFEEYVVTGR